ncbi:MAG: filamentous hemagglutinin N-terminal domain-containing protein [Xenococcaceae cyanobacterium MO_188.B32]|nr:filamentous hemagglutinin N-terminal domain-containing protein [Xenococcaceae cyanobacterium MO_188.B32]
MVEARLHSWWIEKDSFLAVSGAFSLTGYLMLIAIANRVSAQISPDNSLGAESSVVNSNTNVRGLPAELIEGGAIRDANLFHSFSEFNVNEGQRVYFTNPVGIENILSRVTGGNPSNILGTLGVDGAANLYFLNPNGILFGANAQLDIAGSLVMSTGDSLVFGDGFEFSAKNPDHSPLLTVSVPLGVQYGSEGNGAITNRGFLAVDAGKNLVLVGGDLIVDGGGLVAPGGRVDVGGLTEAGTIEFNSDGSLSFPDGVTRGDVFFSNGASIDVLAGGGGSINVNARNLELTGGSSFLAGISPNMGNPGAVGGDIVLSATDKVLIDGERRNGSSSRIVSNVYEKAEGNSGGIEITTGSMSVTNGAAVTSSIQGKGNSGGIKITATGEVRFDGEGKVVFDGEGKVVLPDPSRADTQVNDTAVGNSGGIEIKANSLKLTKGGILDSNTFGIGDAGTIKIKTNDLILLDGKSFSRGRPGGVLSRVTGKAIGTGGTIDITTNLFRVTNDAAISANTNGGGNAGDIFINANILELANNNISSAIGTGAAPNFDAGDITLNISEKLLISDSLINAFTLGSGKAGNIKINTPQLIIDKDGSVLAAARRGTGNGGTITIDASQVVTLTDNSQISVETNAAGKPGNIFITTPNLTIDKDAEISATVTATSTNTEGGGSITIHTSNLDLTGKLGIFAETQGVSPAGTLKIQPYTEQSKLNIKFSDTAILSTLTTASGAGGDINLTAPETINISGEGKITAETSGSGNAGNINFSSQNLNLANGLEVSASTSGEGSAGSIKLDANRINLSQAEINAFTDGEGNAGSIFINHQDNAAESLTLTNNAKISTEIQANGQSNTPSNIEIQARDLVLNNSAITASTNGQGIAGNVDIQADTLESSNSKISATTSTDFQAGDITLTITDNIIFNGADSGIFAETTGAGKAGDIEIISPELNISEGATISALTEASGNSGSITINASESITLGLNSNLTVETSGAGKAGDINITSPTVTIGENAQISATVNENSTNSEGGGNININAANLNISGKLGVFAETKSQAPAGDLSIQPNKDNLVLGISFTDQGFISASTSAIGKGGDINISAPQTIGISGEGKITAETFGSGNAGNINFSSQNLNLADGLEVSASTSGEGSAGSIKLDANRINFSQAEINAFTNGQGNAGSILIDNQDKAAESLTLTNNAKISTEIQANGKSTTPSNIEIKARNLFLNNSEITASTSGVGDAGNVLVQDAENIVLDRSSISTTVNQRAKGQGGNINLQTQALSLRGRSQISARSEEEGKAGNITIEASKDVTANDSDITTAADRSSGGAINISAQDIHLRSDSDITTNVDSGAGGGGNINLTADSIIAFDDSDIFAFARDGRGGNINLNSPAFFGESFRPAPEDTDLTTLDGNDRVDVNASGVVDGVITLPDVSFIQNSLIELPENLINTNELLANSCIVRSEEQRGNFTIPGAGGLPTRPGDAAVSPLPTGNVRTLPEKETSTNLPKLSSRTYRPWKSGDPIVEPTGVFRLPNGQLIISRDCP